MCILLLISTFPISVTVREKCQWFIIKFYFLSRIHFALDGFFVQAPKHMNAIRQKHSQILKISFVEIVYLFQLTKNGQSYVWRVASVQCVRIRIRWKKCILGVKKLSLMKIYWESRQASALKYSDMLGRSEIALCFHVYPPLTRWVRLPFRKIILFPNYTIRTPKPGMQH